MLTACQRLEILDSFVTTILQCTQRCFLSHMILYAKTSFIQQKSKFIDYSSVAASPDLHSIQRKPGSHNGRGIMSLYLHMTLKKLLLSLLLFWIHAEAPICLTKNHRNHVPHERGKHYILSTVHVSRASCSGGI